MFGFKISIKTENITRAVIERWEKLYGTDLCLLELDGKKGYLRPLSEKEVGRLVKNTCRPGSGLATSLFIKKILNEAWLGGDDELIKNETYLQQVADLYTNLPKSNTIKTN